jgi:hypothetical protein
MTIVTVHTAKTTLSQLLLRTEAGEAITIARARSPWPSSFRSRLTLPSADSDR